MNEVVDHLATRLSAKPFAKTDLLYVIPPTKARFIPDRRSFITSIAGCSVACIARLSFAETSSGDRIKIGQIGTKHPQSVEMERRQVAEMPTVAQTDPLESIAENQQAALPLMTQSLEPIIQPSQNAVVLAPSPRSNPLQRSRASRDSTIRIATDSPTATESIKLTVEKPASAETEKPHVEMERSTKSDTAIKIAAVDTRTQGSSAPKIEQADTLVPIAMNLASAETAWSNPLDSPLKGVMQRRRSTRRIPMYAVAHVNMQNLLMRRKLDQETKQLVVEQFGGSDKTLEAIERGLVWIEQHQESDGHWGLNDFSKRCKDHKRCSGHGNSKSDTAGTALALLALRLLYCRFWATVIRTATVVTKTMWRAGSIGC